MTIQVTVPDMPLTAISTMNKVSAATKLVISDTSAKHRVMLNPRLGYDRVAQLVQEALDSGQTLRELVLKKKLLTESEYDALVASSTAPNL